MDRILRASGASVSMQFYDANADPADPGTVTADVTDSAGVAVAGLTGAATTGTTTAPRVLAIPASLTTLDHYFVRWNMAGGQYRESDFELVGAFLFAIKELQTFEPLLADETAYPLDLVRDVRQAVEDTFESEQVTGRAFRPRGRRVILDGNDSQRIRVPDVDIRSIVSASIDGVALTAPEIADIRFSPRIGRLTRWSLGSWTWGSDNVSILYEYGMRQTPDDVRIAAMRAAREELLGSALDIHDRATAAFTDAGAFRITLAGRDGTTGLPKVDAVLERYARASAKIGGFGSAVGADQWASRRA